MVFEKIEKKIGGYESIVVQYVLVVTYLSF